MAIELRKLEIGTIPDIVHFPAARDLLSRTNKELHQILSPFQGTPQFSSKVEELFDTLIQARTSLDSVKPEGTKAEQEAPQAIYNAIEGHFARIDELKGDLVGLFEQQTTNFGDDNARH